MMEFSFFLADRLGMTVSQLETEMSNDEFVAWGVWHGRRLQREELAAKMAKHQGG